ncbi:MAG: DUF4097 domain-containing protein [Saccharofermentans sp.]|nr:DUF4097 domain-containing protein [Saccharofermentans sp.]
MSKSTKTILILASCLIVAGLIISGIAFLAGGGKRGSSEQYEQKSIILDEEITSIDINLITEDVILKPSSDDSFKVEYFDGKDFTHYINVEDETLKITVDDHRSFQLGIIDINSITPNLVVYIPSSVTLSATRVEVTTGDIEVNDFTVDDVFEIKFTTGDINISNISATAIAINGTTGDVDVNGSTSDTIHIGVTTGDIDINNIEALGVSIYAATGDIDGSILGEHEYDVDITLGDSHTPESVDGAPPVNITVVTGDVNIR